MNTEQPVALITGAARRIGACIAKRLHEHGYRVVIHYHRSREEASALCQTLNHARPNSAVALPADLNDLEQIKQLADKTLAAWGRLDALINNASSFYPTPVSEATPEQWDDLFNSNLKAPFFLTQALADALRQQEGTVLNIADVHAERPLKGYTIYCAAKAGNVMLTKSLARELAPAIRVNGIAPGAILWPEDDAAVDEKSQQRILSRVPLKRPGEPEDIAQMALTLIGHSPYVTGQIIAVDGGRSVT